MDRIDRRELRFSGWELVVVAALAMGAAGIYQFGWSSIRLPLGERLGAPESALGTVFTLFVVFQTLGQFPAGWVRDRYGPRLPLLAGALCLTGGFAALAVARSLPAAYLGYALGGVGVSAIYTVAVNTPVKWFTDRRGLATGIVGMSFPGLSFLLIPGLRSGVAADFERTLLVVAAAIGGVALVAAAVLRDPAESTTGDGESPAVDATEEHAVGWRGVVRTWQFWLLYLVFVAVNGVGLMVIGKIVSYASALSLPAAAGTAAASAVALSEAGGTVVGGSLSDRFGRRRTVAVSLVLCGVALAGAVAAGEAGFGAGFVALVGAAALFRAPVFAVFPNLVADYYGRAYSSENYAALYTGKLFGGVLGGTVASGLVIAIGWSTSFVIGAALAVLAGLAMVFLRPVDTGAA
ncbi:MFS transporter [Halolamina litorea]|uniref:MFS transporter n=1 Tax=Halolamina litorea TaxID=1515593 RepID=A0ABD6BVV8_9EURY|nr:MFS transporter [Halolamina litorea]